MSNGGVIIGGKSVGPDRATLVVAEAGVNHDGEVGKGPLQLIDAAVEAGADAVKFQVFRAGDLVTADAPTAEYQGTSTGYQKQREMLARLELDGGEWDRVGAYGRERGISLLATPFGVGDVARVVAMGAVAVKIASPDLTNSWLLAAAARTGLPLIVSTGAATKDEIEAAALFLQREGAWTRVVLLHCVSAYPTPESAANLGAIRTLSNQFGVPTGFSDHTLSTRIGAWAVAAGAVVLEKHLTLDNRTRGPDHGMSLDPVGFAEYVRLVREVEDSLGAGQLGMQVIEEGVRTVARRSVVAAKSIGAGAVLTADMLTLKRPGTGIGTKHLEALIGRIMKQDIPSDTMLTWEMLA